MVRKVEVGGYNLPDEVAKNTETVVGKYAVYDFEPGDYILVSKIAEEPAAENAYLYSLNGEKQAMSVTVPLLPETGNPEIKILRKDRDRKILHDGFSGPVVLQQN